MKISLLDLKPVAARLYFEYLSEPLLIQKGYRAKE